MWDLWWTKWHWDRFFPEYFGFPLSLSFHRCSITWKNKKKIIFIVITGLHKKPQGCGASVISAVGPFTTKEIAEVRNGMRSDNFASQNHISLPKSESLRRTKTTAFELVTESRLVGACSVLWE
jgi:hypothetical protein